MCVTDECIVLATLRLAVMMCAMIAVTIRMKFPNLYLFPNVTMIPNCYIRATSCLLGAMQDCLWPVVLWLDLVMLTIVCL